MYGSIADVAIDITCQLLDALERGKTEPDVIVKFVDNLKQRPYSNGVTVGKRKLLKVRSAVVHQRPYATFHDDRECNRPPCNVSKVELGDILFRVKIKRGGTLITDRVNIA